MFFNEKTLSIKTAQKVLFRYTVFYIVRFLGKLSSVNKIVEYNIFIHNNHSHVAILASIDLTINDRFCIFIYLALFLVIFPLYSYFKTIKG